MYRAVFALHLLLAKHYGVCSLKFKLMDNVIPSSLLEVTSSRTASQCCVVCAEKSDCKFVTYNGENNNCHLHKQHFVLFASNSVLNFVVYYIGESYFELVKEPLSRDSAQLNCEGKGGHLINIQTSYKQTEVADMLNATSLSGSDLTYAMPWTGGKYAHAQGDFLWNDGSPIPTGYLNWNPTQPDNSGGIEDCIHLTKWYTWNDIDCGREFWSICEYDL